MRLYLFTCLLFCLNLCSLNAQTSDLELSILTVEAPSFAIDRNITIVFKIENKTGVDVISPIVGFGIPAGFSIVGSPQVSSGQMLGSAWDVGTLHSQSNPNTANHFATLNLVLNVGVGIDPNGKCISSEVQSSPENDIDSTPGNGALCSQNEDDEVFHILSGISSSPPTGGGDLVLTILPNDGSYNYGPWSQKVVQVKIENNSGFDVNNINVKVPHGVYSTGGSGNLFNIVSFSSSAGAFNPWVSTASLNNIWTIPNIPSGASATLDLTLYINTATDDITIDAEVEAFTSSASLGVTSQNFDPLIGPQESDEARIELCDTGNCTPANSSLNLSMSSLNPTIAGADGSATVVATGGIPPYTYAWSGNSISGTTSTISGLGAGTYSVTVTDSNNATSTASVTLVVPPPTGGTGDLVLTVLPNDGSYNFSAPYSTKTVTVKLENNSTTVTATNIEVLVPAGGYTPFSVTNGLKINMAPVSTSGSFNLWDSDGPKWHIPSLGPTTSTTLEIPIFADKATGSMIMDAEVVLFSPSNEFGVTPDNLNVAIGPQESDEARIELCVTGDCTPVTNPLSLIMSSIDPTNAGANGSATAIATGGTSPYAYAWSGNGASGTTSTISGLGVGTYSVTVTDSNNATSTASVTLVVSPPTGGGDLVLTILPNDGSYNYAAWSQKNLQVKVENNSSVGVDNIDVKIPYGTYQTGNPMNQFNITNSTPSVGSFITWASSTALNNIWAIPNIPSGGSATLDLTLYINTATDHITIDAEVETLTSSTSLGVTPQNFNPAIGPQESDEARIKLCPPNTTCDQPVPTGNSFDLDFTVSNPSSQMNNGSVTYSVLGGSGAFTALWNTGATTNTITGLAAGTYSVTVTDVGNGQTVEGSVLLKDSYEVAWEDIPANMKIKFGENEIIKPYDNPQEALWGCNTLAAGEDGWLEIELLEDFVNSDDEIYFGFLDKTTNIGVNEYNDDAFIDFNVGISADTSNGRDNIQAYEKFVDTLVAATIGGKLGDIVRIERIGNEIKYYLNSQEIQRIIPNSSLGNLSNSEFIPYFISNNVGTNLLNKVKIRASFGCDEIRLYVEKDHYYFDENELGFINVQAVGGTPPYQFNWESNSTNQNRIIDLMQGDYRLTVTDGVGNTTTKTIPIYKLYPISWDQSINHPNLTITGNNLYEVDTVAYFNLSSMAQSLNRFEPDSFSIVRIRQDEDFGNEGQFHVFLNDVNTQIYQTSIPADMGIRVDEGGHSLMWNWPNGNFFTNSLIPPSVSSVDRRDWSFTKKGFTYDLVLQNSDFVIFKNDKKLYDDQLDPNFTSLQLNAIFANTGSDGLNLKVYTNIPPAMDENIDAYYVLEKELDGRVAQTKNKILRVKFHEFYDPETDQASINIFDWTRANNVAVTIPTINYGDTWLDIDLKNYNLVDKEIYTLELTANKGQVYKLRFEYLNADDQ